MNGPLSGTSHGGLAECKTGLMPHARIHRPPRLRLGGAATFPQAQNRLLGLFCAFGFEAGARLAQG